MKAGSDIKDSFLGTAVNKISRHRMAHDVAQAIYGTIFQ
jgi:hypothetical protein